MIVSHGDRAKAKPPSSRYHARDELTLNGSARRVHVLEAKSGARRCRGRLNDREGGAANDPRAAALKGALRRAYKFEVRKRVGG